MRGGETHLLDREVNRCQIGRGDDDGDKSHFHLPFEILLFSRSVCRRWVHKGGEESNRLRTHPLFYCNPCSRLSLTSPSTSKSNSLSRSLFYKGHSEITRPFCIFMVFVWNKCQKAICPLLAVPNKTDCVYLPCIYRGDWRICNLRRESKHGLILWQQQAHSE